MERLPQGFRKCYYWIMQIQWAYLGNISKNLDNKFLNWCFWDLDRFIPIVTESYNFFHQHNKERLPRDSKIWLGIGGSSLGAKLLAHWLGDESIRFLENLDPLTFNRNQFAPQGAIIVSKSGSTFETLKWLEYLEKLNQNIFQRSVVVTQQEPSPLKDWADRRGVPILAWPSDLPGRYSLIGPWLYGVLPEIWSPQVLMEKVKNYWLFYKNEAQKLIDHLWKLQNRIQGIYLMIYSDLWAPFGPWLEQLWNESLGQENSPWPFLKAGIGSADQHSNLQFLMDSPLPWLTFILDGTGLELPEQNIKQFLANSGSNELQVYLALQAKATALALQRKGKPVIFGRLPRADIPDLLGLGYLWMNIVSALGIETGLNPYQQPGVELGKAILKQMLLT